MKLSHAYLFEAESWDDYGLVTTAEGPKVFVPRGTGRHIFYPAKEAGLVSAFAKLGDGPNTSDDHLPAYRHYLKTFGMVEDRFKFQEPQVVEGRRHPTDSIMPGPSRTTL